MSDNIEFLRELYKQQPNGNRDKITAVVKELIETQEERDTLREVVNAGLAEAPASATVKVVNPKTQMEWLVTARLIPAGKLLISGLPELERCIIDLGYVAMDTYVDQRRNERAANNSQPPTNGNGQPKPPPAPQPQPAQAQQDIKTGRGKLISLTIQADGKADFVIDGLKYPLKDSRGPAAIAGLFDPSLGWEPGHFSQPAIYTERDFGQLWLDWHKPGKYYDVVRIYAA